MRFTIFSFFGNPRYKVKFTDGFNANYHSFPAPSQEAVQNLHDAARRAEGLEVIVECMLELMESYLMGTNVVRAVLQLLRSPVLLK